MVYYRDNWYLDAFCHDKDGVRTFSMDAIERANILEKIAVSIEERDLALELESGYEYSLGLSTRSQNCDLPHLGLAGLVRSFGIQTRKAALTKMAHMFWPYPIAMIAN